MQERMPLKTPSAAPRKALTLAAKLWMCVAVAGLAAVIGLSSRFGPLYLRAPAGMAGAPTRDIEPGRREAVARHFSQGTALLNARQYERAVSELHLLLKLAPAMPEAHVNMGFALIGLRRFAMARTFFDVAIELRRNQLNAYFGLALALEGSGDVAGALGAMRSYVHLSGANDPYLGKANAAIGQWEAQLRQAGPGAGGQQIPAIGKAGPSYPIREKKIN